MRHLTFCAAFAALGALAVPAGAADDDVKKQLDELRRQFEEQKARDEARIAELERKLAGKKPEEQAELQKQIDDLVDRLDTADSKWASAKAAAPAGRAAYIDVSFNALFTGGTSSAPNDVIEDLEGGHHDPHRRGFTLQNAELVLSGAVDPYFKGAANIVTTIDESGETVIELEEVYAQTTSLPYGLQVKAGKSFLEFGRQNPQHPHQWDFVDQPVVLTRMFGDDGMNGTGARVSWFVPTRFPFELLAGVYNANGNQPSFAGPAEDGPPIGEQVDRGVRTFDDMLFLGRADASFDLTDEMPLLVGVSVASGPSGASASGQSSVYGADVTLKWKPLANDHGFPFVAFTTEAMLRHFGYDSFVDEGGAFVPGGELHDSGAYAQAVWGFRRDWTAGLRYDRANGTDDDVLGLDDRNRWSAALTWFASEFSKIRLQVNSDDSAALEKRVTSVWLQFEFNLGTHGAHKF
jgi:hypothetical protein